MDWKIPQLIPAQGGFLHSTARHPNMTAAWGTGKTMMGILKGCILSGWYPGNKGLILRRNMTDLRDSTMSDFSDYTELKVKVQSKTCVISNGLHYPTSEIIFHHVDELAGVIQNINLGWFLIEQAEELDNEEVFETLGGRLRRVLTPLKEVQQRLVKMGFLNKVVNDFRDLGYEEKLIAESAIICELHQALRQGFIIANTKGHNWNWRKFKNQGTKECLVGKKFEVESIETGKVYSFGQYAELFEATTRDNAIHLSADFLAACEMKKETAPSHYRRFVLNSWEDSDIDDRVIPYDKILEAVDRDLRSYGDSLTVLGCDIAEFGNDKTVVYVLKGCGVIDQMIKSKRPHMETAGEIYALYREHNADSIGIDDIGEGAGVRSELRRLLSPGSESKMADENISAVDMNKWSVIQSLKAGRSAMHETEFARLRDEMWWNAKKLFEGDYVSIPNDSQLIEELAAHTYWENAKHQPIIVRKKDVKKTLGWSPDKADALVMALWIAKKAPHRQPVMAGSMQQQETYNPLTFDLI